MSFLSVALPIIMENIVNLSAKIKIFTKKSKKPGGSEVECNCVRLEIEGSLQ